MEIQFNDLEWFWFKGNQINSKILQDVCLFRSCVLFDSGFRKNFGVSGKNFGDIQYADFESYHVVASLNQEIMGTVRVVPPHVENLTYGILGSNEYKNYVQHLHTTPDKIIEINRLMIDDRVRKLNLGRTLMFASVALVENIWKREEMTIIGIGGHKTRQVDFFTNYTDTERVEGYPDKFYPAYNDNVSFLRYKQRPYDKGHEKVEFFKKIFSEQKDLPFETYKMNYKIHSFIEDAEVEAQA